MLTLDNLAGYLLLRDDAESGAGVGLGKSDRFLVVGQTTVEY